MWPSHQERPKDTQELAGRGGEAGRQRDLNGSRKDCGAFQPCLPLSSNHTSSVPGHVLGGKKQKTVSSLTWRQ